MAGPALTPPKRPTFRLSLSGQLLTVTLWFVLTLQALMFVPAMATYREQWIESRLDDAQLLALTHQHSLMPIEQWEVVLEKANLKSIRIVDDDGKSMHLQGRQRILQARLIDVRGYGYWQSLSETISDFFGNPGRHMRLVAYSSVPSIHKLEVVVSADELGRDMRKHARRVAITGTLVSIVSALIVYFALSRMFVRPLLRVNRAMRTFRNGPDQPENIITPSGRHDELGRAEWELQHLQTEVQRALIERRRLAALGQAVAKIAHDLRNMLSTAHLSVDRLSASADPKVASPAKRLAKSISRASTLAETAMSYGKAEEPAPKPTPLMLKKVLEFAADDAGLGEECLLNFRLGKRVRVYADPDQVHRVFMNIFKNAREAGATEITVVAKSDDQDAVIDLVDNGPGIPERLQEQLFQPFSGSTRADGFGLGLSIVKELLELNKGKILLQNTDETGTHFAVVLPIPNAT